MRAAKTNPSQAAHHPAQQLNFCFLGIPYGLAPAMHIALFSQDHTSSFTDLHLPLRERAWSSHNSG